MPGHWYRSNPASYLNNSWALEQTNNADARRPGQLMATRTSKENVLLPSLKPAYDTGTDTDWGVRFAAGEVIDWAPYDQMVDNTFLNDTTLTGSGGNAALSLYESWSFNVAAEDYFAQ